MQVFITGASGRIASAVIPELLGAGHEVVGLDNFSKYGPVRHGYDDHPRYRAVVGDAKDLELVAGLLADCDHFVAAAAFEDVQTAPPFFPQNAFSFAEEFI